MKIIDLYCYIFNFFHGPFLYFNNLYVCNSPYLHPSACPSFAVLSPTALLPEKRLIGQIEKSLPLSFPVDEFVMSSMVRHDKPLIDAEEDSGGPSHARYTRICCSISMTHPFRPMVKMREHIALLQNSQPLSQADVETLMLGHVMSDLTTGSMNSICFQITEHLYTRPIP